MISVFSVTKTESFISISLANINNFCNNYSVFLLKEEGKSKRSRGGDTPAVSKNKILRYLPLGPSLHTLNYSKTNLLEHFVQTALLGGTVSEA